MPSAGNAAGALAAYAAAAGMEAHIFMPKDVPFANYVEAVAYGAKVTLVDGLISDCGRMVAERKAAEGWFDVSTLKEPFRVEGKKTMGYELVEQLGWEYPDAVFYPTGGGVGLIGMWKAFGELEELGWVKPGKRPLKRQNDCGAGGGMRSGGERLMKLARSASVMWQDAATFASGLRVPKPYGDAIMLEILKESEGIALAVNDEVILASILDWARNEGDISIARGRGGDGCLRSVDREWISEVFGQSSDLQYWRGVEVYRCDGGGDGAEAAFSLTNRWWHL